MINKIKKFFKELKRVKWPTGKEGSKTFFSSMAFIIIASIILFGIAVAFTTLWGVLGVGING